MLTHQKNIHYTFFLVAPELLGTGEVSSASDIWSLACTIVELLNGGPPYHHSSQMEILYLLLDDSSPVPLPPDISPVFFYDFFGKPFYLIN